MGQVRSVRAVGGCEYRHGMAWQGGQCVADIANMALHAQYGRCGMQGLWQLRAARVKPRFVVANGVPIAGN